MENQEEKTKYQSEREREEKKVIQIYSWEGGRRVDSICWGSITKKSPANPEKTLSTGRRKKIILLLHDHETRM